MRSFAHKVPINFVSTWAYIQNMKEDIKLSDSTLKVISIENEVICIDNEKEACKVSI